METKDRIRMIMEDQHMTQQVFADFIQQSPATLSSIFNGRTRPTLNIVDAIKKKFPDISIEWLLYGIGEMYASHPSTIESPSEVVPGGGIDQMLNFESSDSDMQYSHSAGTGMQYPHSQDSSMLHTHTPGVAMANYPGVKGTIKGTHLDFSREDAKMEEKEPRKVTEIRVYYDDQTYETFVPAKK